MYEMYESDDNEENYYENNNYENDYESDNYSDERSIPSVSTIKSEKKEEDDNIENYINIQRYHNLEDHIYVKDVKQTINSELKNKILYNITKIENEKKMIKHISSKHEYYFKTQIYNILLDFHACIFGGAIRDLILHDNGAVKFYEEYKIYKLSNTFLIYNSKTKTNYMLDTYEKRSVLYQDKNFHPESFIDRNTILNDIDVVMHSDQFILFVDHIKLDNNFSCYHHTYNNFKDYIDIDDPDNLISSYKRLYITKVNNFNYIKNDLYTPFTKDLDLDVLFRNKCYPSKLIIDVFICKKNCSKKSVLDLITNSSDFYCNTMYLYNNILDINIKNINLVKKEPTYESIHEDKVKKYIDIFLQKVIHKNEVKEIIKSQILERKAIHIEVNDLSYKRIKKMKKKNFSIFFEKKYFKKTIIENEVCLFCMDNIICEEQIKFLCCNSNYHTNCLKIIANSHDCKNNVKPCYMCRKNVDFKYIRKYLYL